MRLFLFSKYWNENFLSSLVRSMEFAYLYLFYPILYMQLWYFWPEICDKSVSRKIGQNTQYRLESHAKTYSVWPNMQIHMYFFVMWYCLPRLMLRSKSSPLMSIIVGEYILLSSLVLMFLLTGLIGPMTTLLLTIVLLLPGINTVLALLPSFLFTAA